MRAAIILATGLVASVVAALPAVALEESSVPEQLLGMVGDWRLEQEDQSLPTCALTFTEDETAGGWQVLLPAPCPAPFPPAESFAAWNIDTETGAILIMDAASTETLRLFEEENGRFATEPGIEPAFYLMLPYDEDGMGGEVPDEY